MPANPCLIGLDDSPQYLLAVRAQCHGKQCARPIDESGMILGCP